VDEQLGVIRVTRVVNAVAAGRILKYQDGSQPSHGQRSLGIGMALHEETLFDRAA
jgi:xanthine dehydrogenase YagR molybdenum-binding subunit